MPSSKSSASNAAKHIRSLIRAQEKAQRPRLLAAAVCAIVVSVGAVVLLGLSGWFLTASALAGMGGVLVAKAFNYMIPSAMIRLTAILRTAGRYGERITGHDAALYALAELRPQLFEGLAGSSAQHSLSLSSGEASARLMQDVDAIQNRFVRLSAPWAAGAATLTGIILAAFAGWQTALAVALMTLAGMATAALIGKTHAEQAGRDAQSSGGALKDTMASYMAAAPELRAYAMTDKACAAVDRAAQSYDRAQHRLGLAGASIMSSQMVFTALAVLAVYLTAGSGHPALTALAILGGVAAIDASGTLMQAIRQNGAVKAATERLEGLISFSPDPNNINATTSQHTLPARIAIGDDLTLKPRERLAIIGSSGSGKTTLIERLMHLRPVIEGEIRLGDHDLANISASSARQLFAYAPQQAQLINGTVADNLRLAHPEATEERLWQVLEAACLADRFRHSPQGLKTRLGENGSMLSGGEKRRLGLARAYMRHAPFLILDEPTEGLDAETEASVMQQLDQHLAMTGQGLIMVSHRPHPLSLCSKRSRVTGLTGDGRINWITCDPCGPQKANSIV